MNVPDPTHNTDDPEHDSSVLPAYEFAGFDMDRRTPSEPFVPPLLHVSDKGKILWGSSPALRLLRTYCDWTKPSAQLPDCLRRMVSGRSHTNGSSLGRPGNEFLIGGRQGTSLHARLIKDNKRLLLLLYERSTSTPANAHGLTKREAEVFQWLAAGKSNKDIGTILAISPRTVEKHLGRIFQYLGVETRTAAAAEFYRLSHPHRTLLLILSLGVSLSMIATGVSAAMVRSVNVRTDQTSVQRPISRWSAGIHLVANEKPVETKRPKKQDPPVEDPKKEKPATEDTKPQEPVAEEHPAEETKTVSPVGVAPETQQETLPHTVFSRIIDLPGAGVLTPKGALVVEPYLQFAHLSSNRVTLTGFTIVPAITIGLINVQGVSRNIYTGALVGRYGLTNRLELELRIPYLYRDDTYTLRPIAVAATRDTVEEFTGSGLGDIETTARYQINQGGPDDPYFVGFLRFKSTTGKGPFDVPINPVTGFQNELPTGSGFYILQPGLTVLYPSDPAVLFGSVSFIWNMPRDVGGQIGTVEPGNGANANLGLGISLNEKLSLSLGYDHTVFARPTAASNLLLTTAPTATHVGVLLLGAGYQLNDRTFVNFVVGVGATREAPDLQVTLRIPTALFWPK